MINRVILVGNLTKDAEIVAAEPHAVTRMRLATNVQWRDAEGQRQSKPEYHSVVAFGPLAHICSTLCTKGRRMYVEGHLQTRTFEGRDGIRRSSTEVVAETLRMIEPRGAAPTEGSPGDHPRTQPSQHPDDVVPPQYAGLH